MGWLDYPVQGKLGDEGTGNLREGSPQLLQVREGETTMQRPTLKRRQAAAIGFLLLGTLFLVATCGGPAHPGSQPNRTPPAASAAGASDLFAPATPTTATPTLPATAAPSSTSASSPTSAPSAIPTAAATPVPANGRTASSNTLLPRVILAALAFVALLSLLSNRRRRRPPPDAG